MKTILIVDDDESIRKLVAACLRKSDCRLIQADHGELAVALATREKPDLALVDIILPGGDMDGFGVSQMLKNLPETRNCRVILMSGKVGGLRHGQAATAGADAFLEKPFHPMTLRSLILGFFGPHI